LCIYLSACKFDEEVALQVKKNFLHVLIIKLINTRAKIHLDLFMPASTNVD